MTENGNDLLRMLEALSNPYRLRIIASLRDRRKYVSEHAREIGISRPLLYLHIQRLEGAGLISGRGYFGMAFGFGILILGVIVALVVNIQKSKTQRLETQQAMSINLEDEFRKLTGSFSAMQQEIKNRQDKSSEELSQIRTRIYAFFIPTAKTSKFIFS